MLEFGNAAIEPRAFRMEIEMIRNIVVGLFILSFAFALGACGDTWSGAKKDTGENMQKTGAAIEKAGEKVKK